MYKILSDWNKDRGNSFWNAAADAFNHLTTDVATIVGHEASLAVVTSDSQQPDGFHVAQVNGIGRAFVLVILNEIALKMLFFSNEAASLIFVPSIGQNLVA